MDSGELVDSGGAHRLWDTMAAGASIGPHALTLSRSANERYWRAAGLDHSLLRAGAGYPLIAANCTVLAWLSVCDMAMIQTRQRLSCRRVCGTPAELTTAGEVLDRVNRRGREYVTVEVGVSDPGGSVWTSTVDFTPAAGVMRPRAHEGTAASDSDATPPSRMSRLEGERRRLDVTDELIRQYSRRGNYHSDADTAAQLGLPGLVAQGTQVCGPAYGLALDAWGEAFLARGELDARFLGMVIGGDEVEATVAFGATTASFEVWNVSRERPAATGTMRYPG